MTRICAHCGTEVDGDALFCPTCGQPLSSSTEPELPPAPDWPTIPERPLTGAAGEPGEGQPAEAEPTGAAAEAVAQDEGAAKELPEPPPPEPPIPQPPAPEPPAPEPLGGAGRPEAAVPAFLEPEHDETPADATHAWEGPVSAQPVPPWRRGAAHRAAEEESARADTAPDAGQHFPAGGPPPTQPSPPPAGPAFTRPAGSRPAGFLEVPQLLSDWLAGIGAVAGLLAMFLPWVVGGRYTSGWGLASGVNIVMSVVLLGVLAVVFFPGTLPEVPRRSLWTMAVGLVGIGIGFDRLGLPLTGAGGIIFLIAMIVVAAGGAVAVLGHDRNVGGPQA